MNKEPKLGDSQIKQALSPVLRYVSRRYFLGWLVKGIAVGCGVATGVLLAARFVPMADSKLWAAALGSVGFTLALIRAWTKRPGWWEAALAADGGGLKERAATAWQLRESAGSLTESQCRDALAYLTRFDCRKSLSQPLPKRELSLAAGLLAVVLLLVLWTNPLEQAAKAQRQVAAGLLKAQQEVNKTQELAAKNEQLPKETKKEIARELEKLRSELSKAKSLDEALVALAKSQKELAKVLTQAALNEKLNQAASLLQQNPLTKEAGESLAKGDLEEFRRSMEELAAQLKDLSKEDQEKLAKTMSDMAQAMLNTGDKQLSESLAQASQALTAADGKGTGELNGVKEQLAAQMASGTAAAGLATALQQGLSQAKSSMLAAAGQGNQPSQTASSGQTGQGTGGNSGQEGSGQGTNGNGNGNGNGAGTGSGSGSGAGAGQGSGKLGGPAGNGSSNLEGQNGGPGSNTLGGSDNPGPGKQGQYEQIYAPTRAGGTGQDSQVNGASGDSGDSTQVDSNDGLVSIGSLLPYSEVLAQYQAEARESIEKQDIPINLQDLVKDYFLSLAGE